VNGKQVFKSLKTERAEHAKTKLPVVLKEFARMGRRKQNVLPPETTVSQLSELYLESVRTSVKNKASTAHYREQTIKAIFRTWPELKAGETHRMPESNRHSLQKTWVCANHSSRSKASVCNPMHREWDRYSDGISMAWA